MARRGPSPAAAAMLLAVAAVALLACGPAGARAQAADNATAAATPRSAAQDAADRQAGIDAARGVVNQAGKDLRSFFDRIFGGGGKDDTGKEEGRRLDIFRRKVVPSPQERPPAPQEGGHSLPAAPPRKCPAAPPQRALSATQEGGEGLASSPAPLATSPAPPRVASPEEGGEVASSPSPGVSFPSPPRVPSSPSPGVPFPASPRVPSPSAPLSPPPRRSPPPKKEYDAYQTKNWVYIASTDKFNYNDAFNFCYSRGYRLIPYNSKEHSAAVAQLCFENGRGCWENGQQDDYCAWVDPEGDGEAYAHDCTKQEYAVCFARPPPAKP
ncbi:hypothetical protein HYH03_005564 [Edaphochlamys debaryana]|uniref:C-type lectin domain-containing protein n=1 Tax=Edaphochlamys debaryana TaxID=47281 RepID=A0A835Y724_9CHLO|nr:hypothetical protein HYH03_005564 [Edaphochlamys debaryana]|eukprot:KAG2496334.1 hypothetical protein HYH03_005564 [Edaphochlamys debaryana]